MSKKDKNVGTSTSIKDTLRDTSEGLSNFWMMAIGACTGWLKGLFHSRVVKLGKRTEGCVLVHSKKRTEGLS